MANEASARDVVEKCRKNAPRHERKKKVEMTRKRTKEGIFIWSGEFTFCKLYKTRRRRRRKLKKRDKKSTWREARRYYRLLFYVRTKNTMSLEDR